MKHTFSAATALIATFSIVLAQSDTPQCGNGSQCPQSSPCCSEYGQCGVGAYCLGGCDPKHSFDLSSCTAKPTCQSGDFKMDSLGDVKQNTVYLGDPSSTNWVASGMPLAYNNEAILLTMAQSTVGTLLTSTHYVWYGKISATMTSSEGQGVVTAFIMMSDMKDEIDFEFVGNDVNGVQSNYYWQGVTDYTNMVPLNTTNTRANTHTYTFDWQPDQLTWAIDGNVLRTLNRSDTWNATTGLYHYPQTPARIQLSLWPAGLPTNGNGTVEWAGGLVNWNSPYMQNGYYYAMVNDVNVECYNPPPGFSNDFGSKSYYYNSAIGTNNTVVIGNNNTVLSSFYATGDDISYDPNAKASGTTSAATPSATPETVPGVSGGGVRGGSGSSSSSSTSGDGSGSSSAGGYSSSTFQQNGGSSNQAGTSEAAPKLIAGSVVALLGFFVAALML